VIQPQPPVYARDEESAAKSAFRAAIPVYVLAKNGLTNHNSQNVGNNGGRLRKSMLSTRTLRSLSGS
jgi:hypothetical protein